MTRTVPYRVANGNSPFKANCFVHVKANFCTRRFFVPPRLAQFSIHAVALTRLVPSLKLFDITCA